MFAGKDQELQEVDLLCILQGKIERYNKKHIDSFVWRARSRATRSRLIVLFAGQDQELQEAD